MKSVGQHSADAPRPAALEPLPFRLVQTEIGSFMEWDEDVVVPVTGERLKMVMSFGRNGKNGQVSWSRLERPICRLMEMYRQVERRCAELEGENERLKVDLSLASGQVQELQNSAVSLERARNQGMKGKKNGV